MSIPTKSLDHSLLTTSLHGGYAKEVEENNPGISLRRMPPAMEAFYDRTPAERIRRVCPAGVRMEFVSDSRILRCRLRFGGRAREIFTLDTIVDGEIHTVDFATASEGDWVTLWQSPGASRKPQNFQIWFSHYAETEILDFAIEESASFDPVASVRPRWIALGDSITQGMIATSPARSWATIVARDLNLDITNFGVGGAIMEAGLADFLEGERYDFLTIAYGTNDCAKSLPLADYQDAYRNFFSRLRLPTGSTPRIFVIGPPIWFDRPANDFGLVLADYQRALKEVCQEFPAAHYVDGFDLIPGERKYFPPDDIHPNDLGMAAFAKNLAKFFN